jgi:alkanesulfonate monooxygenase SsuD/methylene tetrahydromethanopterin reductase-like flavin-dependent oxidoreductase (luciferase family)
VKVGLLTGLPVDLPVGLERVCELEARGFDGLFLGDGYTTADLLVALGAAGAVTVRMTLASGVTDVIRRSPVELAGAMRTLQRLTDGRVILGLGSGKLEDLRRFGHDVGRPVARLEEAIHVMRLLWDSTRPVDFSGDFYVLRDALLAQPTADGDTRVPIWIAAHQPRMLRLTGQLADGWLPSAHLGPDQYRACSERIDTWAAGEGRQPSDIVRALTHVVALADRSRDAVESSMSGIRASSRAEEEAVRRLMLRGSPASVAGELDAYDRAGCDYVVLADFSEHVNGGGSGSADRLLDELRQGLSA